MTKHAPSKEKLLSWMWKALLIIATAVPVLTVVFFWYQNNFEMPLSETVLDTAMTSPWVFSALIGLIGASFAAQYFLGSPTRRKTDIRRRTPVLIFIGPVIVAFISVLAWWQSDASWIAAFSKVAQKPFMLGSVAGLTVGSLLLAFVTSAREEQKRCLKILVTLVSVFLMFGGPYLIYAFQAVEVPYSFATLAGLVSLIAGIIMFLRFVVKGIET